VQKQSEERWSLVSVAFGAVTGTIVSVLIQPFVDLLPGKLFEEFPARLVDDALLFGLPILLAFAAARIRRLDRFLQRYLAPAAVAVSLLLGLSLWIRAGEPAGLWPVVTLAVTVIEAWLFPVFCGGTVRVGLLQIAGPQQESTHGSVKPRRNE
jgi:hypothetical protein